MIKPPRIALRWLTAGSIVALVVTLFVGLIWFILALRPAKDSAEATTYDFASGMSVHELAGDLADKGIIRSSLAFEVYVTVRHVRSSLEAGSYELSSSESVPEIVETLSQGRVATNRLTIPEGTEVSGIRKLTEAKGVSNGQFDAAMASTYGNTFLSGRPAGDTSLEGYLFPDSYEVAKPIDAKQLIQQMLNNFAVQVNRTDVVQAYAAEGLTLHQGLVLASIVEKEAGTPEDRPKIAQVFLKRLKLGMPLQSDVTTMYAAEQLHVAFDIRLDSRYNTYAYTGLPPGPICNPGIDAMKAVAHPAATDYLYFLADKHGTVHYATTAEEHQANVQKYLR